MNKLKLKKKKKPLAHGRDSLKKTVKAHTHTLYIPLTHIDIVLLSLYTYNT